MLGVKPTVYVSGISTIASDDAEMQLTELSGRPVAEDAHGIFVVRQNGVSRKVVK